MMNHRYWKYLRIHSLIDNLRLLVEIAKRIPTKEKIDKQLACQSTSTPFMKVRDGCNTTTKAVIFNTQDRLDDKIDKLASIMCKLTAQGSKQDKQFNLIYIKEKIGDR